MNRAILEQPFPTDVVKTRKGSHGHDLSYVEAAHYIKRLNDAFDGKWTWRIVSREITGDQVIVHGVLEAGGIEKHAFGGTTLTFNKSTNATVSIADDLKASATDALKKACSLFGIGLELYAAPAETTDQRRAASAPNLRAVPSGARASSPEPPRTEERNRLTAKQLHALYAIAHGRGMSDGALKRASVEKFGVMPEFLTRSDASTFIGQLSERSES